MPLNKLSEADREAAKTLMEKARAALKSKEGGDDNPFLLPARRPSRQRFKTWRGRSAKALF